MKQNTTMNRPGRCDKHGNYVETGFVLLGKQLWTGCPECQKERKKAEENAALMGLATERKRAIERVLGGWVPERFKQGFDAYKTPFPEQKMMKMILRNYAEGFVEKAQKTGCAYTLLGNCGTGKTHLGCAVLLALFPRVVGAYVSLPSLAARVRASWAQESTIAEADITRMLTTVPFLVVDELGTVTNAMDQQLFYRILDERYANKKPTLCITNLTHDEMAEMFSERTMSRLAEVNQELTFEWENYRLKKANGF